MRVLGTEDKATDDVRVVVVDDYAEIRFLLGLQLEEHGGVRIVGEAGSMSEAIEIVGALRPDVVVLDQRLGRRDSVSIIGDLRRLGAEVIVVSGQLTPSLVDRATGAGAVAVLDKHEAGRLLPEAVTAALV